MEELTHFEKETVQVIWPADECNVTAFMEHLDEFIPYTTVASTVKNPGKKAVSAAGLLETLIDISQR